MKIWTLMENTACGDAFLREHGLSFYIETKGKRLLFDMGQTDGFAKNAKTLGLDLGQVDMAVISHGHYDHGGGLQTFLKCSQRVPVYVSSLAFGDFYNASDQNIGLEKGLRGNGRLRFVEKTTQIAEGITLIPAKDLPSGIPIPSCGLKKREADRLVPDDFLHEQYLLIEEDGNRILFTGCAHRGIGNIRDAIPCDVCIGGFHLSKLDPRGEAVAEVADGLGKTQTRYYTCHCTGLQQYHAMKETLGDRLQYLAAGSILEL